MQERRVAAIVLNYNGRDLTLQTIESLLGLSYPRLDIVVVDNGSTDGSHQAVSETFPEVIGLRVEVNRGISVGLNLGIGYALENGYDYVLILNNDIEVEPHMLDEMLRVAESDPSIGCVGPKTYYYEDRQRLWSAGGVIRFKESVTRERGMGKLDRGQYDEDAEVDYVNGCAMLVSAAVMRAVGLWDPIYHVSVEDADWCLRMKRLGYRCFYAHRARLWHMVSPTTGGYRASRTFHTGRSTAIFVRRHARPLQRITFLLFFAVGMPLAFLREPPRGNQSAVIAKIKGVLTGMRVPMTDPPVARIRDRAP